MTVPKAPKFVDTKQMWINKCIRLVKSNNLIQSQEGIHEI